MSLQDVAENFWKLTVVEMLPVAESFGSDVILRMSTNFGPGVLTKVGPTWG